MTDLKNARRLLASGYPLTLAGAARVVDDLHADARQLEDAAEELDGNEKLSTLGRAHDVRSWALTSESLRRLDAAVRIAEALRNDETPTEVGARPPCEESK